MEELNNYIEEFYIVKSEADKYKKLAEENNKKIKELMEQSDLTEFTTENGLIAKITIQNRESFIEPKLIEALKKLELTDVIKTVEVIDYDELENAIYNGLVDAATLSEFKETKQIQTLKVSKKKGE